MSKKDDGIEEKRQTVASSWTLFRNIMKLYEKMLRAVCEKHALSTAEADVIGFLKNHRDKDTAAEISEIRLMSKGAVSKAVDALMKKGLLRRHPDDIDRRKIHLKLTEEAGPIVADIDQMQSDFRQRLFTGFSPEEIRLYKSFEARLYENAKKEIRKEI